MILKYENSIPKTLIKVQLLILNFLILIAIILKNVLEIYLTSPKGGDWKRVIIPKENFIFIF